MLKHNIKHLSLFSGKTQYKPFSFLDLSFLIKTNQCDKKKKIDY